MVTRSESAAATRLALLDAAAALLDSGGPEAVTLRDVGARAGVSRSAPYRHFADKDALLTAVAASAWDGVTDELTGLDLDGPPRPNVRQALGSLVALGRTRPHLYRLMYTTPAGDPRALIQAAQRSQDLFLAFVTRLVGPADAERSGALLLACAHGITGLDISGNLPWDKWHATGEDLIDGLVALLSDPPPS